MSTPRRPLIGSGGLIPVQSEVGTDESNVAATGTFNFTVIAKDTSSACTGSAGLSSAIDPFADPYGTALQCLTLRFVVGEIEQVLTHLSKAGVRYLVVGGVAVVLHGYLRATADLDLVIDLEPANLATATDVLQQLGFRPRPPVALHAFVDVEQRTRWIEEKNLQVFSLWHPEKPGFELDLFVKLPFDFEGAYLRARIVRLGGTDITVVSIDDLMAMKRRAGRARDQEDIDALLALQKADDQRRP